MNIYIICVGKIKESFFKDALKEYSKRLSRYCTLKTIEIPDEKIPEKASPAEEIQIKDKEGIGIIKELRDNMLIVTLEIQGEEMASKDLANFINLSLIKGNSNIAFVIGGTLGLSDKVLAKSKISLSFSKMTFPHQLMRVILLEQIYRAFKITLKEPYHR
ncbi:MAG TPA: 23S rRNA (pseudouridine(1915)-N(3))-methyltransferase RlmH [Clostridiaceae bacterium]